MISVYAMGPLRAPAPSVKSPSCLSIEANQMRVRSFITEYSVLLCCRGTGQPIDVLPLSCVWMPANGEFRTEWNASITYYVVPRLGTCHEELLPEYLGRK